MNTSLITFQEIKGDIGPDFIAEAIRRHKSGDLYQTAVIADEYDRQRNTTIYSYVQMIFTITGSRVQDFTASNNKIASNFFHRLNTQRNMYSLGNGVSFAGGRDGRDETKERLGDDFDSVIQDAGYDSLKHGVSFIFWNDGRIYDFPVTQFVPIWDEGDGTLRAGIRFWRLSPEHPTMAVVYEENGYSKWRQPVKGGAFDIVNDKRAYKQTVAKAPADISEEVIGEENYSSLPIVPLWGSKRKQSTLIGMRESIDSYDLIRSGFANDLTDVSQIYWIVENAGGMDDEDLARFRDRLKITHIANADTDDGGKVTPYTQEIPYNARKEYLTMIRDGMYEDFGALDVHTVAAGATNDHIDAAYQPMDEEAADYEKQLTKAIKQLLEIAGIDDTPVFKRSRISNQKEQVEMVSIEAQWLDDQTVLSKLPNISPEEVADIIRRKDEENMERMPVQTQEQPEEEPKGKESIEE